MSDARRRLAFPGMALVGFGIVLGTLFAPKPVPSWGAVCASWLFVSGAAMGLVALLAATRVARAHWLDPLVEFCRSTLTLMPWCFAILLVLVGAGPKWIPWLQGPVEEGRRWWLNLPAFAIREFFGTAILFALAVRVVNTPRQERSAFRWSVAFLITYACVLTMWALDFVLALDRAWVSPLIGAHYFMGSLLAASALVAIAACSMPDAADLRHDIGKLVFALCVFWAYLFYAQLLTQWYGNLPEEIEFWLLRRRPPWLYLGLLAPLLISIIPFFVLMRSVAKRNPRILRPISLGILFGLWLALLMLILPSLDPLPSPTSALAALGTLLLWTPLLSRLGTPDKSAPKPTETSPS